MALQHLLEPALAGRREHLSPAKAGCKNLKSGSCVSPHRTRSQREREKRLNRTALISSLVICASLVTACGEGVRRNGMPTSAKAALDIAIEDIDAGRHEKLYNEADDEWRKASTLEQSKAIFKTLHDKLGNVRTRDLQSAREEQTSTAPIRGHSLVVVYQTTFDRMAGTPPRPITGMETFTLLEHDGRWYLARYFVTSNELK